MKFFIYLSTVLSVIIFISAKGYKKFSEEELNTGNVAELYKEYLTHHPHKKYKHDSDEGKKRLEHFKKNLEKIKKIRAQIKKNNEKWEANLNSMSDISKEEFDSMKGLKKKPISVKSGKKQFRIKGRLSEASKKASSESLTKTNSKKMVSYKAIDWRSYFLEVRNQQTCGSCWTFAVTGTLEGLLAIKNPSWTKKYLSPQQLVNCAKDAGNGCNGGDMYYATLYMKSAGIVADSTLPYTAVQDACTITSSSNFAFSQIKDVLICTNINPTTSYTNFKNGNQLPNMTANNFQCTEDELYNLLKNGPVSVGVDGEAILHYAGGIYDGACNQSNHAVIAVGYGVAPDGTEYWLIRNSWSATWGEGGYIRIKRNSKNNSSCFVSDAYVQPLI